MKDYLRSIAAYLTGWVIAQSIFLRVLRYVMRDDRGENWRRMADDLAVATADELESRRRHNALAAPESGRGHEDLAEKLWVHLRQFAPEAVDGTGLIVRPETLFAACRSLVSAL